MRYSLALVSWCAFCALGIAVSGPVSATEPTNNQEPGVADAALLVREALVEDLAGNARVRELMLERAIELAPDYAPARWHAGHVRAGDQWLTIAESEVHAKANPRLADYAQLRHTYTDDADDQLELARWCQEHGLTEQARRHWHKLLAVDPQSAEALRALGKRWYGGALLTDDEIEADKERANLARTDNKRWTARVKTWTRFVDRGTADNRQRALAQIRAVRETSAIDAFESVTFPVMKANNSRSAHREKLAIAVVDALAEMPEQAATESLVRHAVMSHFDAVRDLSTEHLKDRPLHSFVPQLLNGLAIPLESSFHIEISPSGSVFYDHSLRREGPHEASEITLARSSLQRVHPGKPTVVSVPIRAATGEAGRRRALARARNNFRSAVASDRRKTQGRMVATARADANQFAAQARTVERQVAETNAATEELNERIYSVLSTSTGQAIPASPAAWWSWWQNHNEYYAGESKPAYDYRYTDTRYHDFVVASYRAVYNTVPIQDPPPRRSSSCFPRGTPVWTETGRRPIEQIEVGDCVLSQNPDTGQLAYKVVLDTTERPPSPIVRVALGAEELPMTLGHPLWAVGKGWRMAKQLSVGDALHTLRGSTMIDRVDKTEDEDEAFNLVVADFNTYFVGNTGVLVHDNTPRRPTRALLPGFLAR